MFINVRLRSCRSCILRFIDSQFIADQATNPSYTMVIGEFKIRTFKMHILHISLILGEKYNFLIFINILDMYLCIL